MLLSTYHFPNEMTLSRKLTCKGRDEIAGGECEPAVVWVLVHAIVIVLFSGSPEDLRRPAQTQ